MGEIFGGTGSASNVWAIGHGEAFHVDRSVASHALRFQKPQFFFIIGDFVGFLLDAESVCLAAVYSACVSDMRTSCHGLVFEHSNLVFEFLYPVCVLGIAVASRASND